MNVFQTAFLVAAMAAGPIVAIAQAPAPQVQASNAWSRATPGGASTGAVYLTLSSPAGDTLTGVSSPLAKSASVHEMSMDGNVMRMRPVTGGLPLPAGQPVMLRPGGDHIMLEGLKAPLKQGQSVPLHLTFAKSAPVDATATVAAIGASAPGSAAGGSGMKMP
ncbi:MAG: copper chaperone PCu(A)C [Acetobacteraceae bacterium]|nr:copper chaperone PCu(A)C [Acetobacteraceae bacterium]